MSILDMRLTEIQSQLETNKLTVSELVEASLTRIKEVDQELNAFITVDEEGARTRAQELDALEGEKRGLLFGLPIGLKDNISTEGLKTTCASKILSNFIPLYDATVVEKLREAEAVTVGKLNMDEFAMGSTNETSFFGAVRNPWNKDHVPGGSSGGSAAAVAAREVYFALGSDTGGSVRQPAAFCGVVGLKPTYGLISRYGVGAMASSLDQIGTLTKNVEDTAYLLQVLAGYDGLDSTSADQAVPDYVAALTNNIQGLRIAVPKEFLGEEIAPEVKEKIMEALAVLKSLGATWEEVSLPHVHYAAAAYYILSSAEASSNLARYDGVRYGERVSSSDLVEMYKKSRGEGFGDEVKRRIILGTYALSSGHYEAYYVKAQQARTLIKQEFEDILSTYDVIIGPTAPTAAYKLGEQVSPIITSTGDNLITPVNLAGIPAISIPCGLTNNGLPVGLQIIGKAFDESTILRVAHAFEQNTTHHQARPNL